MIVLLTLPQSRGHIRDFIRRWDHSFARRMTEMTYDELLLRRSGPTGAYVFCDRVRMTSDQRRVAALIWNHLCDVGGDRVRLHNNPTSQFGRFELLQVLADEGQNAFRAYWVDSLPHDARFPLFLRVEDDHAGPRTKLLNSHDEVREAVEVLAWTGVDPKRLLAVEYLDTSQGGIFRKFGAFRAGDRIVGQHVFLSRDWSLKWAAYIRSSEAREEYDHYYRENPHAELLMPTFERANVDYGRIDYSMLDGRVQVWEINDSPKYVSTQSKSDRFSKEQGKGDAYMAAFERLAVGLPDAGPIEFDFDLALRDWGRFE